MSKANSWRLVKLWGMREMKEEKYDYVDDDFEESRRRWEGIHNDEAAQYRMPFEDTSPREWVTCCILPSLGVMAVLCIGI